MIQFDIADETFVTLSTGNKFHAVHLKFADSSDPAIAALLKHDLISAICIDVSEVGGTPILTALANKMARTVWALLARNEVYRAPAVAAA